MQQPRFCCLPLKRAFSIVLYLDMSRIIWGLIICAFLFQSDSALSLVITIADIISIVIQSAIALYVSMRALPTNNFKPIIFYRRFKLIFILMNILDRLIVPIIDCTLIYKKDTTQDQVFEKYCRLEIFITLIITSIVWNLLEYYFYIVVRTFAIVYNLRNYRPVQNNNVRQREIVRRPENLAALYEVNGLKPNMRRGVAIFNPDRMEQGKVILSNQSYTQPINGKASILRQLFSFHCLGQDNGLGRNSTYQLTFILIIVQESMSSEQDLMSKIKELQEKLDTQTADLKQSQELEEFQDQEIKKQEQEIKDLKKQLSQNQNTGLVTNNEDQTPDLKEQIVDLTKKCEELEFEIQWYTEKQQEQTQQLAQNIEEIDKKEKQLQSYKQKYDDQKHLNANLNEQLSQLQIEFEASCQLNLKQQEQATSNLQNQLEQIGQQLKEKDELIKEFKNQIDDLEISVLEKEDTLQSQEKELNQKISKLQTVEKLNQSQKQEIIQLENKVYELQLIASSHPQPEYMQNDLVQSEQQNNIRLQSDVKNQKLQIEHLEEQLEQTNTYLKQIQTNNAKQQRDNTLIIQELETKLNDSENNRKKIENQLNLKTEQETQLTQLKNQYAQSKVQNEAKVQELEQEILELNEQIQELKFNTENKNKENETLQQSLIKQQKSIEIEQNTEILDLNNLIDLLKQENLKLQNDYNLLLEDYNDAKESSDQIVTQSSLIINKLNAELVQLQEQVKDFELLEQQIQTNEENVNLLSSRNQILEELSAFMRELNQKYKNKTQKYQTTLKEITIKFQQQQQKNENELLQARQEIEELQEKIIQLEANQKLSERDQNYQQNAEIELNQLKTQFNLEKQQHQREIFISQQDIIKLTNQLSQWQNILIYLNEDQTLNESNNEILEAVNYLKKIGQEQKIQTNQFNLMAIEYEQLQLQLQTEQQLVDQKEEQIESLEAQIKAIQLKSVRKSIFNTEKENNQELQSELESLKLELDSFKSKYESLLLMKQRSDLNSQRNLIEKDQIIQLELENSNLKEEIRKFTSENQKSKRFSTSQRASRISLDCHNLSIQLQLKQQELEEKEERIKILTDQLENQKQEKQGKLTLKQIISGKQNDSLNNGNGELENKIHSLQRQVIEQQIKIETLNGMAMENLKLKKRLAHLQVIQTDQKTIQQSPQKYSPLNPFKVINHLKERSPKKIEDLFTSEKIKSINSNKLIINDFESVPQKKQILMLQRMVDENKLKLLKYLDSQQLLQNLVRQLILDVRQKQSTINNEDVTRKKQLSQFFDKIVQQMEFIYRKIIYKEKISPRRIEKQQQQDDSCI